MRMFFNGCLVILAALLAGCGTTTEPGSVGVKRPQFLLVPSEEVNQSASKAYQQVLAQAQKQGALDRDAAQVRRIRTIVARLIPQTAAFRQDAPGWQWEVHVLSSSEVNAWCMPGGKIAVYTGLIDALRPTDDELAAVIGHEMGHALREHSRERVSAALAEQLALNVASAVADIPPVARDLAPLVLDVTVNLPYSRRQETEADRVGVELAARAAYDPRAAIVLWEKMQKAGGAQPPKLLATHPSPEERMRDLRAYAEKVMPLYVAAASGGSPSAGK
jgi:Zn-dependent protease with chaperone function